jgi:hypothetical protein
MDWERINTFDLSIHTLEFGAGGGNGRSQGGYGRQERDEAPAENEEDYEIVDDVHISALDCDDNEEADEETSPSARALVNSLVNVSVNTSVLSFLVCEGWHALASAEPLPLSLRPRRRFNFQAALPFTPVEMVADRFVPAAA